MNIMRINAPRRNHSASEARVNNGIDLDRLALRALAELVVDIFEERAKAVESRHAHN